MVSSYERKREWWQWAVCAHVRARKGFILPLWKSAGTVTRGLRPIAFLFFFLAQRQPPTSCLLSLPASLWNVPLPLSLLSQVKQLLSNYLCCSDVHSPSVPPSFSWLNTFQTFISVFISVWPKRKHLSEAPVFVPLSFHHNFNSVYLIVGSVQR